jgi:nucleotide-binding universal stress UspA family protein
MGAFQHPKLAEELLGGVTERILRETRLPVLMSH